MTRKENEKNHTKNYDQTKKKLKKDKEMIKKRKKNLLIDNQITGCEKCQEMK